MIKRILSLIPLFWALGFAAFVIWLPRPVDGETTDAIVVLTGAPGRIERGLKVLEEKRAKRMFVSGVYRDVKPHELALAQHAPIALFDCCIDLGREANDTRENAQETANWIARHDYRSVRLVTTDWHMRRARSELERAVGDDVRIVADAVKSDPGFAMLFKEYHKYLLSRFGGLLRLW